MIDIENLIDQYIAWTYVGIGIVEILRLL